MSRDWEFDTLSTSYCDLSIYHFREMVLPTMTCFEPETKGQLIEGTQFHQFMFESSSKLITKTEIVHDSNSSFHGRFRGFETPELF